MRLKKYGDLALGLFKRLELKSNEADCLYNLARIDINRKKYTSARTKLEGAGKFYEANYIYDGLADTLDLIAICNYKEDCFLEADDSFKKALEICTGLKNELRIAQIYINWGGQKIIQAHYNEAWDYLCKGFNISRKYNNQTILMQSVENIKLLASKVENGDDLLSYITQELSN